MEQQNNIIPISLAQALQHWTCYICDVRRSDILNEGSIKYAISEFLEVSKSTDTSKSGCAIPRITKYQFEYTHPVYKSKTMDLEISYVLEETDRQSLYEFKYARVLNITKNESERYIDDIFRLATISNWDANIDTYFLLLGPKQYVENLLTECHKNVAQINYPSIAKPKSSMQYNENIRLMLSLERVGSQKKFNVDDLKSYDDKSQLERFYSNYDIREIKDENCKLLPTTVITSELVYTNLSSVGHDDIIVNIWKVKSKN